MYRISTSEALPCHVHAPGGVAREGFAAQPPSGAAVLYCCTGRAATAKPDTNLRVHLFVVCPADASKSFNLSLSAQREILRHNLNE